MSSVHSKYIHLKMVYKYWTWHVVHKSIRYFYELHAMSTILSVSTILIVYWSNFPCDVQYTVVVLTL